MQPRGEAKSTFVLHASELRVLLLPTTSRDAEAMQKVLEIARIHYLICRRLVQLTEQVKHGAGMLLVAEEVLAEGLDELVELIRTQPVWSDLPIVILSRSGNESPKLAATLANLGNVSVLERPVRVTTLLSVVKSSLRARLRQYEVREHLAELARTQQELHAARDAAEGANRAKDRFLAVLSHELRTPLTPVLLSVAAMEADPDAPDAIRKELAMVRRNIQMESKLIDDLLDLSRVSNGKLQLHRQSVEVNAAVRHVFDICQSDVLEKGQHLHLDLSPSPFWVNADPTRLNQAIWNLFKNAVKFTPEKGQLFVRVSPTQEKYVRIEVRDTGIGISPSILPNIFDAFEQGGDGITQKFGGLGLGLAISKALVELHGGMIQAISGGVGNGSTFAIELPLDASAPKNNSPFAPAPEKQPWKKPPRLLVVEDHHDTATVLMRQLQRIGCLVTTAANAESARGLASNQEFDVLISDIGLPDARGYELMGELSRLYGLHGIAMSGYGMETDIAKSKEAGFSEHLTKPIDLQSLESAIRRLVG